MFINDLIYNSRVIKKPKFSLQNGGSPEGNWRVLEENIIF